MLITPDLFKLETNTKVKENYDETKGRHLDR